MEREGSVQEEDPSCSKGWTSRKKRSNVSGTRDRVNGFATEWLGWGLPTLFLCHEPDDLYSDP